MAKFKFSAKTATGATVNEVMTADSENVFLSSVKERKLYLIDYKQLDAASMDLFAFDKSSKLSLKQLTVFCRQIWAMMNAGVSLVKAIDILYQQSYDKVLKKSIQKLYESVQKGDLLSEGLRKQEGAYPEIMITMVESGEASGTLDVVMGKLADQFEADLKLRNKIGSAIAYPAILACLCVGVVALLVVVVLPSFGDMFADMGEDAMPLATRMLLGMSVVVGSYWYVIIFLAVAAVFGLKSLFKTEKGRRFWDNLKLTAPMIGAVTVRVVAVRFCRTFATLFSSGMAMLPALDIVGRVVGNRVISDALANVREDIRKGVTLSQAVSRVPEFPPMIHSMISIGEESGTLDSVLESSARYFDDEVENAIQRMVTFIEPALLIFMAAIVAFVIISIMLPMVAMYQSIQ